jgi:type II secretory pathway pseudopilin PulG
MTARRLRESPRVIVAGLATGVVLVLVGVLIGSATAGGGSSKATTTALRRQATRQGAQLQAAQRTIVSLRAELGTAGQRVSAIRSQLTTVRARARCWRTAALHHAAGRVPNCAAQT